jgi:2-haloacid dehalogenase
MKKINNIIFDLGGVLVDWNPDYMYKKIIPDETKRKWFLENVCSLDWNEQQDAGRTIKEGTNELISLYPEYKDYIVLYYTRWEEMLNGPIHATVDIFRALKKKNQFGFYALTNWSAETFPRALEIFDFFHWFDGRVVSGEEKTRKPFRDIYEIILSRYGLVAEETVFIDDNIRNIKAGQEIGLECIHFTNPENLSSSLTSLGLL